MKIKPLPFASLCNSLTIEGYTICCRTVGGSMFPLIRSGNSIEIEPIRPDKIQKGDIVAYHLSDFLIAHRVIGKKQENGKTILYTKGDAYFCHSRQRVMAKQILGRVISIESSSGRKINLQKWPMNLINILLAKLAPIISIPSAVALLIKNKKNLS